MGVPSKFYQAVKSTVDYLGHQISQEVMAAQPQLMLEALSLDATTGVTELLKSDDPAIVWMMQGFSARPRDPLYELVFLIGPKTTSDVSGELMAQLMGVVQNYLPDKSVFEIKNYSGPTVSEELGERGWGFVQSTNIQEQVFDQQSSIRMATVVVLVSRDIS